MGKIRVRIADRADYPNATIRPRIILHLTPIGLLRAVVYPDPTAFLNGRGWRVEGANGYGEFNASCGSRRTAFREVRESLGLPKGYLG